MTMPDVRLDFPFTPQDTPPIRERIVADLTRIAHAVAHEDPHLDALVLTGGFSRGEGTVRDARPVNDYDLVAVRRRPGGDARYRGLAHTLSEEVGLEVDLLPVWRARLPHVARKLFWLDMRLGGRVILGDPHALGRLPRFAPARMARAEAARLLGNRAAGLLLALPGPDEPEDAHQRDLQATKAVLAAMDANLLARGTYAPRLRDRLDLSQNHPDHEAFRTAVAWKLDPDAQAPPGWWDEAARVLLAAVDATDARGVRDGMVEPAFHALRARRLRLEPSRRVREVAWALLASSRWPDGPADPVEAQRLLAHLGETPAEPRWSAVKARFFALRAATLQ